MAEPPCCLMIRLSGSGHERGHCCLHIGRFSCCGKRRACTLPKVLSFGPEC